MAKILIVEDSAAQAALMAEIVKEAGHEAVVCKDPSKGVVALLSVTNPDLVILDLVLVGPDGKPIGDGFQICREIKRATKNSVAVVIVSAKEDEASAEWAIMQGADAFLQKPFVVEDLLAVMKEALAAVGR